MGIRKNQANLSQPERDAFVNAVKQLKVNGVYDTFVQQHRQVFENQPSPAHFGPGFLPWHREFLLRFEIALQRINPNVSLPYWDWTIDDSKSSSLWDPKFMFMGGDGSGQNGRDLVTTGPFAYANGWHLTILPSGENDSFLKRALGRAGPLPSQKQVTDVSNYLPYDLEPWHSIPNPGSLMGFRKGMEFVVHTLAHAWVGGSMDSSCSPNDPVFWLHHCNVDRLWARWQSLTPGWPYVPPTGTPDVWLGHGLDDPMMPPLAGGTFSPTPHVVLNHRALGYQYDTEQPTQQYAAISWEMGSYWRAYGCNEPNPSYVYELRCDRENVGQWTSILPGRLVSAILMPGSSRNPPYRIYVVQNLTGGGQAVQEYSWDGRQWVNSDTWPWPPSSPHITSIAAVSWQNGSHIRVYVSDGNTVWARRQDGQGWNPGASLLGNLVSAISWEDSSGAHIRLHVWNNQGKISVWTSSDGQSYKEEQLP